MAACEHVTNIRAVASELVECISAQRRAHPSAVVVPHVFSNGGALLMLAMLNEAKQRAMLGLWDQGLFTDALISAVRAEHIYPYTYLQAPRTSLWRDINWPDPAATVANLSASHVIQWRQTFGHFRPVQHMPPDGPQRKQWERERQVLEWQQLVPLPPLAALHNTLPAGLNSNGALDAAARILEPTRVERVAATPDWLYCLVGRWAITAGWPSLSPAAADANAVCAVLHLVESRSQVWTEAASVQLPVNSRE